MAATTAGSWVGRSIQRVEDDALLRGEGRFLDDLAPIAHSFHAAIVRSPLAHARIEVDAAAALTLPGVVGVLTGADVASLSRPFPAGIESGTPQYAAAIDTVRYVGEPIAVVVARDRYLAEDAAELVEVDYDPLEPVLDPVSAAAGSAVHDRRFAYGDADAAMAAADLVLRQTFRFPRFTCTPVECFAVVADWDVAAGRLTAWANFQGPFTLHGVAAAALGLKGDRLRLLTPPDSGGSFGIKSAVFSYVVLIGLASRHLGVPVTWIEDRLEHLAASAAATGRTTEVEAGFTSDGRLIALRYDAIEDVGAYVRAPEPATLYRMHGSLSGAYRVSNVAVRNRVVLTNTIPSGLNRGFGGPQLYLGLERTMAIAARRLGLDPADLARRNLITADEMPYRTPSGALYDSGDAVACLDKALELADYGALRARVAPPAPRDDWQESGSPASSSRRSRTWGTSRSPRRPMNERSHCPSRATPRAHRSRSIHARRYHGPDRDHATGTGSSNGLRASGGRRARVTPDDVTVLSEMDTASVPWTVASGNYSSRFSGVGVGAVQAAALKLRAKIDAIRGHAGDETLSLRRVAGPGPLEPRRASRR